jgi:uncharacterized protein (DUF1330 family)
MPVEPNEQQMGELAALAAEGGDRPIVMLNLNRYRDRSEYERYGEAALPTLARVGGRVLWHTQTKQTVIGEDSDQWDEVIAVWYPSAAAFMAFGTDPEIVAALPHRAAGLERAALICCEPGAGEISFGEPASAAG